MTEAQEKSICEKMSLAECYHYKDCEGCPGESDD